MVTATYPVAPAVTKPRGTLLDAARVGSEFSWLEGDGLWDSYNCLDFGNAATWPCPEVTLAAPVQAASSTSASGGTLPADTYRAVITAVNDRGETVKSNEISQVTTGATSTVTFNWAAVTGATSYRVYLTDGAAGSQAIYVTDTASPYVLTAYPPTGAEADTPPTVNTAVTPITKTFGAVSWIDGFRFAAYGGVVCKAPGLDRADMQAQVSRAFETGESKAVEAALMENRFVVNAAGSGLPGEWVVPTDITPTAAVTPQVGVAMLEGYARSVYVGVPTLHLPVIVASMMMSSTDGVAFEGDGLFTKLGSKVAAGAGYDYPNTSPTGAAAATGEKWAYVTGEVVVGRSEFVLQQAFEQTTNEVFVLVERGYIVAVDCFAAAIRIDVSP